MDEQGWVPIKLIAGFKKVSFLRSVCVCIILSLCLHLCGIEFSANWNEFLDDSLMPCTIHPLFYMLDSTNSTCGLMVVLGETMQHHKILHLTCCDELVELLH